MAGKYKVMLLVNTSTAYGQGLLRGIIKYARATSSCIFYSILPFIMNDESIGVSIMGYQLDKIDFDGFIVHTYDKKLVEEISISGVPSVVRDMGCDIPNSVRITSNNILIAEMAFNHLKDRGLRHFAFCGLSSNQWSIEREKAFRNKVAEADFVPFIYKPCDSKKKYPSGSTHKALSDWVRSLPKPVGIMATNDYCGQHIVDACDIAGINIPNEVAVIGVDNEEFVCELTNPPMTSIARNFDKAGYQAIELLTNLMAGKENRDRNIIVEPSNVVVRQSTNTLAIEDEDVTEALRFIYSSSFERYLCVDDVAIAVATSKRGLYQKFMQILGHSVHEEINRVRTDRIMQLLIETTLPISKIAFKLGFSGPDHISRYFRARKGMSTLEFRKHHQRF